jgi:hypothetical protein
MNKNMLQQAQRLQAMFLKAQEELASLTVEGSAGGGAVKVMMNGQGQIQSVKISPEAVNPQEVEMLEELVLAAVKDAAAKAKEASDKKLGALTGGIKIPGLM